LAELVWGNLEVEGSQDISGTEDYVNSVSIGDHDVDSLNSDNMTEAKVPENTQTTNISEISPSECPATKERLDSNNSESMEPNRLSVDKNYSESKETNNPYPWTFLFPEPPEDDFGDSCHDGKILCNICHETLPRNFLEEHRKRHSWWSFKSKAPCEGIAFPVRFFFLFPPFLLLLYPPFSSLPPSSFSLHPANT
jgi:hypothetical protein